VSLEEAYEAARLCALNCLGALKATLGNLERIEEIVKVLGFINSAPDFHRQPEVLHGFSDFMIELFGEERGGHARSAIGTSNLPRNQPVEVEMIARVKA
jgi:enamine deaminase RidA (YjgF/YER057c/UK114 family)